MIQVALDRLDLDDAIHLKSILEHDIDILEIGTSYVKDYGIKESLHALKSDICLTLLDTKTIDQGDYEFRQAYSQGADIATVMAMASTETLRKCQKVAHEYSKDYMIDLLEVSDEKLELLKEFEDAYVSVHISMDKENSADTLSKSLNRILNVIEPKAVFLAGGITDTMIQGLDRSQYDGVIVGRFITADSDPMEKVVRIKRAMEDLYEDN